MVKVYEPFPEKKDGKWYKEWDVPDGLPLQGNFIQFGPGPELKFPKFDFTNNRWIEDEAAVNELLLKENEALKARVAQSEGAIMDLAAMVLSKKEEK